MFDIWRERAEREREGEMASEGQIFPPQSQGRQPGKEHAMDPIPLAVNPDYYKPSNKLHGKVAVVIGGDSGIGRAVCHSFALEGATVAFTYVAEIGEEEDARDTLWMIQEAKASDAKYPIGIAADLGYDENCKMVVDEVVDEFGRIDVLVNNATEQHLTNSVEEITEERLERVFRTNLFSHFFMTRYALRHMRPGSCIINSASVNAYTGGPTVLHYSATKGANVAFTSGIRVNAVSPGPMWTPLLPASVPVKLDSEAKGRRAAQPHEIAPAYVFLACNHHSSYFTGQVFHPNGVMIVGA